ncbi:MAG: P-type conjugative transfer protein TrbL [Parvibaculum sp.]|jgi:type IV secretion system protein TrbL|uniref:P-type conjugative transfer protein TrbL n=1 Tax=Parvibaculum TaxID=256616 RepID=UPI0007F184C7|nr:MULTISPECIES: P-type conjugative transfer protein TrbL [Parvibaculum]ANK82061.1 MAG: P-type conjugative transfer protein TrbL [Rhizobiales bacterium NRL2]MAU59334.1 P-type conjugative transfer protein TrbL [Parvibaculum sp.]NIJ41479.1 type IV secretion system protein TrbL [Parvibaculum indicum]
MDDINVIDRFTQTFVTYIDSGFGLLTGDVAFLTSILVAIDITLAGLWWALDEGSNVLARLIRKVLYIGAFALILNNWQFFASTIFDSFSGLGLQATNNSLSAGDLLRPGFVAGTGFEAAYPLIRQAGELLGFTTFFDNAVTIVVLVFAWLVVVLAFFILAIQLFITIIEFKLTTLAGFVLVPFALWNKTAFLAERVLGNVVASGIKVMVLAVIIGIGTTLFGDFIGALDGEEPSLEQAMSMVLASLALFGLGIFGPGIAAGLVSGAPQLGAGAAVGTAGAVAGGTLAGGTAALGITRMAGAGGLSAVRAGTALSAGTGAAYGMGKAASGATGAAGVAAGMAGVASAGAGTARAAGAHMVGGFTESAQRGRAAAWQATGGGRSAGGPAIASASPGDGGVPMWARRLRAEQRRRARLHSTEQAVREGDRPGAGANPDLSERE